MHMAARVEPIDSFTGQVAQNSRRRLQEQYEIARLEILRRSNYLKQLAEGIRIIEDQKARNVEFFAKMR